MRYFVHLAYHGKNYHGWQKQPNASSVQEEIEKKISILLSEPTEVVGCGRTDTGVHARSYYLHFDAHKTLDPIQFAYKLNALLPKDISIYEVFEVQEEAHARFDAISRSYEYHIHTLPNPFTHELSLLYAHTLDVAAMNEAAALLLTHTDFECFSKVHTDVKTFNCKITHAHWEYITPQQLVFSITADRFLRNMVRAIVGTLLDVGKGKISVQTVTEILASKNRSKAGESVAAHGLFLTEIIYPNTLRK